MDNTQSVHKWLYLYLVILFLLFVSRSLVFNFIIIIIIIIAIVIFIIVIIAIVTIVIIAIIIVSEVSFFTGRGLLKIGRSGTFLISKGGIKRLFQNKTGDHLYFLKK